MVPNVAATGHSFDGALRYYLHDKGAVTAARVAWSMTRNLGTDSLTVARRVMIGTANQAAELKAAAGVKATGRKATSGPVYAYSLAWHPEEAGKIDRAEMMKAAEASIVALGAEDHQAIIIAHQDEPHPHVHIVLNRVHPNTGKMLATGHDHDRLSAWALAYREARGEQHKYCPQRAEKAATRERHPDPQERRRYVQERIERQRIASDFNRAAVGKGSAIKVRAEAMKTRHRYEWDALLTEYRAELDRIWKNRPSFKALAAQHRADTRPEWSTFGKQQAAERREWHRRERTTAGMIHNALAAVASRQITGADKGYLRAVFWNIVSTPARLDAFMQQQARAKADFSAAMKAPLDAKIQAAKADHAAQRNLATANFGERKAGLKQRQQKERGEIRDAWRIFFASRGAANDWRSRSTARVGSPAQNRPDRAEGAQSVSELRAAYGSSARERNRDRSQRHRRERSRSRDRGDSGNNTGPR